MARVITENGVTFLSSGWFIEDVRCVIEDEEIEGAENFTDEDCVKVLEIVARSHDATIGINWEVIECAIEFYLQQGEKK